MDSAETRPVLLQCKHCAIVLGDSIIPANESLALSSVALTSITESLEITAERFRSTKSEDFGAVYVWLKCIRCSALVGRLYQQTPPELEHLSNMFFADMSSGNVSVFSSAQSEISPIAHDESLSEIGKLKGMILLHNEKIIGLQNQVESLRNQNSAIESKYDVFKKRMNAMTRSIEQDDSRLRTIEKAMKQMQR